MRKTNIILLLGLMMPFLSSCYGDKGNYDYVDVRTLKIKFTPDNYTEEELQGECLFKFKQPFKDTTTIRIQAEAEGLSSGNDALEYLWIVRKSETETDTFRTPYVDVKLPPQKKTDETYRLKITDKTTTLDYHRRVTVKTITPFVDAWFVLHGTENEMKLGTAERSEDATWISADSYFDRWKKRRFQHAQTLTYLLNGFYDRDNGEMVTIIAGDSLFAMHPFDLETHKTYERMMPPSGGRPLLTTGFSDRGRRAMVLTDKNKLFHSPGEGHCYPVLTYPEDADYRANEVCIHNSFALIWDAAKKKFYYYPFWNNFFGWDTRKRDDSGNVAKLESFGVNFFPKNEFKNKELMKIVPDIWDDGGVAFFALFVDTNTNAVTSYHIVIESKETGDLTNTKANLNNIVLMENSSIAVSEVFGNQFFYTAGNILYRYNMTSNESSVIYQVPDNSAVISDVLFKRLTPSMFPELTHYTRSLGLVVNYPDNKGEIHELLLQNTSEVETVHVMGGFEKIKSMVFSESGIVR